LVGCQKIRSAKRIRQMMASGTAQKKKLREDTGRVPLQSEGENGEESKHNRRKKI